MKTKDLIKEAGRELFNTNGVMNVTLREVADNLNKSYGNITYHYTRKVVLIEALFEDMNRELLSLQKPAPDTDLLTYFLVLPTHSYDITIKYLFFTVDYMNLKRSYPNFIKTVDKLNEERRLKWLQLLLLLRQQGYLQSNLKEQDLNYIMLLSVSVRAAYFQMKEQAVYDKNEYSQTVNKLLKPYLSEKGTHIYHRFSEDSGLS
ncbi:MAG: TetR/AcrR family transcriptional regulator [Bacteroidota bacterium]